ncbi:PAS domain-containing sensor histidine kinase [Alicyclobacillus sendaiensis]|uniref:histidine kinase n=1 Tax=Alicyclobacillus sendaiensis PA2 TaxID=3029425 RepID=A0ABT6XYV6_ALISE|nr:ATP-binding protein [Alicyclobacillus sendaiensis]MDI9260271.1 histidine kinase [Alicyclobacillus sendaiensis PA2]
MAVSTGRDSAERLRHLFNALNDGIIVMDSDRIIVFINPSATRITGWELGDWIPYCRFCQERQVGDGEERCFLASQTAVSYFESELPMKCGGFVPVGMSRTFLHADGVESSRDMVIVIRDVTRERQAKELEMRATLNRMTLEVQEQERKRISQELHDGVSQSLYAIDLGMEHLKRQAPSRLHRALDDLRAQVKRCSQEVRALSHTLYPSLLYDLGLSAAIRMLSEEMSTSGCRIEVTMNKEWPAGDLGGIAIHLYRIVQEAVHNAISHGRARHIQIHMTCAEMCEVEIRDDGCGFDAEQIKLLPGYGLKNMRERASALHGVLEIESQPGQGTRVRVIFPNPLG